MLAFCVGFSPKEADMPLRELPMLASHDAATGYMGSEDVRNTWMRTQATSFPNQATCGSRALDLRMGSLGGKVQMHHGGFYMYDQTVEDTMADMVGWAAAHPTELVLLMGSHCECCASYNPVTTEGNDCSSCSCASDTFKQPFAANAIAVVTDCSEVASLTRETAMNKSALPQGGHLLAIMDCIDQNYGAAENIGWGKTIVSGQSSDKSFEQLFAYFDASLAAAHSGSWMLQAMWQEAPSLKYDPFQSIFDYQENSEINARLLQRMQQGKLAGANVVLSNLICRQGPELSAALGATVTAADIATCKAACGSHYGGVSSLAERAANVSAAIPEDAVDANGNALHVLQLREEMTSQLRRAGARAIEG